MNLACVIRANGERSMPESETTKAIKTAINSLPPMMREQCEELAEHIRHCVRTAGATVGPLAVALVGSEMESQA